MNPLALTLYRELDKVRLIDPHTHIQPLQPASKNLADLLGYHYYTELAHSSGLPLTDCNPPAATPQEAVAMLMEAAHHLDNTIQWSWMIELSRELFGFEGSQLGKENWEILDSLVAKKTSEPDWPDQVLAKSGVEALFLTNDFDDPLQGFDTSRYIPCLRTDDLVFHLAKATVQSRLSLCSQIDIGSLKGLDQAIASRFTHFLRHRAKACAISLPPWFTPHNVSETEATQAWTEVRSLRESASAASRETIGYWVFWKLAEYCAQHSLPFDLMIGVNRQVYPHGVYQGQDLYDSRISLIQYAPLLNHFANVKFPISVLASVTNQELTDFAWIFPNVITHGHWWYSNTPNFIRRDLAARMEAIPRNKVIGYYSDAYKLEFILPKFRMFKRILAEVLADDFVVGRCWTESRAIELGTQILRGNVDSTFPNH